MRRTILDIGDQFGELTVVSSEGSLWRLRCSCGNEVTKPAHQLTSGNNRSCGCGKRVILNIGDQFGRLTVVAVAPGNSKAKVLWRLQCECGNEIIRGASVVTSGNTRSCGCLYIDTCRTRSTKHGHKRGEKQSLTYSSWCGMRTRCDNANIKEYKNYGGRGITYDPRWNSFANFLADMGECPTNMSIDRIDNNGNYSKDNCRWATRTTQAGNTRRNINVEDEYGDTMCLAEYCKIHDLPYQTIGDQLRRGWSWERAIDLNDPKGLPYMLARQARA